MLQSLPGYRRLPHFAIAFCKLLSYITIAFAIAPATAAIDPSENPSACWIAYAATGGNSHYDLSLVPYERIPGTWPSAQAALDAATQRVYEQSLGKLKCGIYQGRYLVRTDPISNALLTDVVLHRTTGVNGIPGVPLTYKRYISFQNAQGEYCSGGYLSLWTEAEAWDGTRWDHLRPECEPPLVIKLEPAGKPPESSSVLSSIEPGQSGVYRARVYNQSGQLVPNVDLRLQVQAVAGSGGHKDGHNEPRPAGELSSVQGTVNMTKDVLTGRTDSSGLTFVFKAPAPAGDHVIEASCVNRRCNQEGPDMLWVGIKGLESIPTIPALLPYATYHLLEPNGEPVGATDRHPYNHYLTPKAIMKLWNLGFRYSIVFPENPKPHVNDASLERGGVFDISGKWKPKHHEHQRGSVVDIRANLKQGAIPESAFKDFERIAKKLNIDAAIHMDKDNGIPVVATRHYHVRLLGRKE